MSLYYRNNGEFYVPKYDDGRTKQAFKDQCDINKIIKKAQSKGGLAHVQKYPEEVYGEFDGEFDLLTAHERINRANEIFGDLPSEIRSEFNHDPLAFVSFANNPENKGRLAEIIPKIAEPGNYFPNPVQREGQGAGAATAPAAQGGEKPPEARSEAPPPPAGGGTD